jgi:hypothetical protein
MFALENISSEDDILRELSENVDRLITVDLPFRAVAGRLYKDTRAKFDGPLTLSVARALHDSLMEKGVVLIATGWPDRPHISLDIAESDGPPGAAILGMALHKARGVVPVFLIESNLVSALEKVCYAAGFRIVSPEEAVVAAESRAPLHAAAVLGFPTDILGAEKASAKLLDELSVQAVITIEKGGMNEKGIIHTSRGDDTTGAMAKADILVRRAKERKILTVGIGDGGNEIGMGVIAEKLRQWLPFGKQCRCGCGGGIVPITKTDFLIPAAVSNWGAYGISAMLAVIEEKSEVFHSSEIERRVLLSCIDAGLIDGGSGYVSGGVDSLPINIHMSIVNLLGEFVNKGIRLKQTYR